MVGPYFSDESVERAHHAVKLHGGVAVALPLAPDYVKPSCRLAGSEKTLGFAGMHHAFEVAACRDVEVMAYDGIACLAKV